MADFNNTNLADFSGVWVFCEQRQGKLQPTVLELISEARKLADDMGTEVCGLLLGGKGVGDAMAKELGAYGADKVLVAEDDLLETYTTDAYAKVICIKYKHIRKSVLGGTENGNQNRSERIRSYRPCCHQSGRGHAGDRDRRHQRAKRG